MTSNGLRHDLIVTVNGEKISLFMSFGLLNELLAEVGDLPRVSQIAIDPELRTLVLRSVLSKRDEAGEITEAFSVYSSRVSVEDVQNILQWVAEHTLDFFISAIERNLVTHKRHEKALGNLMDSGSGSPA